MLKIYLVAYEALPHEIGPFAAPDGIGKHVGAVVDDEALGQAFTHTAEAYIDYSDPDTSVKKRYLKSFLVPIPQKL